MKPNELLNEGVNEKCPKCKTNTSTGSNGECKLCGTKKISEAESDYMSKPYGVRYKVFAGKEQRLATKEAWFKSSEALQRGVAKIENLGNFYEIDGYSYPQDKKVAEQRILDLNTIYMEAVAKGDKELLAAVTVKLTEAGMFSKDTGFVTEAKAGLIRNHPWIGKKVKTPKGTGVVKWVEKAHTFSQMVPFITVCYVTMDDGSGVEEVRKDQCRAIKDDRFNQATRDFNKSKMSEEGGRWEYDNSGNMREIPASQAAAHAKANLDRMAAAKKQDNPFEKDELEEEGMLGKARRFVRSNVLGNARTAIQHAKHTDLAQSHKDIEDAYGEPNTWSGRHDRAANRTMKAYNKAQLKDDVTEDASGGASCAGAIASGPAGNLFAQPQKRVKETKVEKKKKSNIGEGIALAEWASQEDKAKFAKDYEDFIAKGGKPKAAPDVKYKEPAPGTTLGSTRVAGRGEAARGSGASGRPGLKSKTGKAAYNPIARPKIASEAQLNELKPKIIPRTMAGGKLNPNHPLNAEPIAKEKEAIYQRKEQQRAAKAAKAAAKLAPGYKPPPKKYKGYTLDAIYQKAQDAIGNSFPDGDPSDHLYPWLEKRGLDMDIVNRAFRKFDKTDFYGALADLWDDVQGDRLYDAKIMLKQSQTTGRPLSRHDEYNAFYSIEYGVIVPELNPWR